jgi:hypothetical protein
MISICDWYEDKHYRHPQWCAHAAVQIMTVQWLAALEVSQLDVTAEITLPLGGAIYWKGVLYYRA